MLLKLSGSKNQWGGYFLMNFSGIISMKYGLTFQSTSVAGSL